MIARTIGIAVLTLAFMGCGGGNSSTVTGTVTFDGVPVKNGHISFTTTDDEPKSAGGQIVDGNFKVKNVALGANKVNVTALNLVRAGEDPGPSRPSGPKTAIPEDAEGNNQTIEIKSGTQEVKIEIKSKKK